MSELGLCQHTSEPAAAWTQDVFCCFDPGCLSVVLAVAPQGVLHVGRCTAVVIGGQTSVCVPDKKLIVGHGRGMCHGEGRESRALSESLAAAQLSGEQKKC